MPMILIILLLKNKSKLLQDLIDKFVSLIIFKIANYELSKKK